MAGPREAVDHDGRVPQHLLDGGDIPIPHVRTNRRNVRLDGGGHGRAPCHDGRLPAIRQHDQHVQVAVFGWGADDGHNVTMAVQQRNRINAQGGERFQGIPIHRGRNPPVQNAQHGINRHVLRGVDIRPGALDQRHDAVALVGLGMQGVRVIPLEGLGGRGMVIADGAAEAREPDAAGDHPTQDRQMAQQAWFVEVVTVGDGAPTAAAGHTCQRAFHGQDAFAVLGDLGLEDTQIRDVQRDRDAGVL